MSTNPFREFKVDKWKVFALDMGNGNLIACLSTYKHREVVVPLFAFTSKLATTISKDLFPRHKVIQFMGIVRSLWERLPSLFHRYANRAIFSVVPQEFRRQARCSHHDESTLLF
jgi:hypothetical protein